MPRGDGTGPMGFGPMTGRGAGYCAGFAAPGFMNPAGPGMGGGRGRFGFAGRGGRGQRNRFYATGLYGWQRGPAAMPGPGAGYWAQPEGDEASELKTEAEYLEKQLQAIQARLEELEGDDS